MIVPGEPVLEPAMRPNPVKEVGQNIPLVQVSRKHLLDAAGTAVRDNVIHLPINSVQRFSSHIQTTKFLLKRRVVRFQDAIPDIVTTGATHGKYPLPH